tara:strand:+ start:626 stop:979 length:354 start_codon:yes stop_codon:yes gene_type:complete
MQKHYRKLLDDFIDNKSMRSSVTYNKSHSLFMGVILRALLDATKPELIRESSRIKVDRQAAKAWFFASSGVTCDNFEMICDEAGVTPNVMRTITKEILNYEDVKEVRKKINSFFGTE